MLKTISLFFIFWVVFASSAHAARKVIIFSDQNRLTNSDILIISASTSGFLDTEKIYFKGAFFKESSSIYFGFTKDNNSQVKNSKTATSQRVIDIGSWDKLLSVKVDFDDTGFLGSSEYFFKIGYYYTNSKGNLSSVNWSTNSIPVSIIFIPTSVPLVDSRAIDEESSSYISDNTNEKDYDDLTADKKIAKTSNFSDDFDKITTNQKQASEYSKIKPIVDEDKVEDTLSAWCRN